MCDFAIWAARAVTVPIYETSSVEQIDWVLSDSGAVAVFAGNAQLAEAIRVAQPAKVEAIWRLDAGGLDALARADRASPRGGGPRTGRGDRGDPRDHVYTSGTTGPAKGCMISHGTLAEAVRATIAVPGVQDRY